jgi:chemotaxis protein methyltransferase CheR
VLQEADEHGPDPAAYVDRLGSDRHLFQSLVDRVTVQESGFFRDPDQLDALQAHVVPALGRPVRAWSAGCANGQEAYSLAMTLAESGAAGWEVAATDVSSLAVDRTRRARYSSREVAGLSAARQARHLVAHSGEWEIAPSLRAPVRVLHHNLVTDAPPFAPGECDVVFCRNVLIYIRTEETLAFLDRVARCLAPDGWLFLGYSESLWP